jgi:CheY-like chemotaxis protein
MLASRRILVADDDLEVRRGVVDLLGSLGPEIFQAETGPEAIEIVRRRLIVAPIHLLVLDMHMPGCSGLEVLTQLRREVSIACICYSGNATRELETQALEAGARAFLPKPVQPLLLRDEVLRALESLG